MTQIDRLLECEHTQREPTRERLEHVVREARVSLDKVIDEAVQALENVRSALEGAELPNLLIAVRYEHDRAHDGGFGVCANGLCRYAGQLG